MSEKEMIAREIGLTFDFLRYLIANPKEIKKIPDGAEIVFFDKTVFEPVQKKKNVSKRKIMSYQINRIFAALA